MPRPSSVWPDHSRLSLTISASTQSRSIRPLGDSVAMRVTLAARSRKLPGQRASGAVAKARLADLDIAPELPAEDALKVELLFWESVKDSSDPEPFQAYLDKYPQGQFVDLALGTMKRKRDLDQGRSPPEDEN